MKLLSYELHSVHARIFAMGYTKIIIHCCFQQFVLGELHVCGWKSFLLFISKVFQVCICFQN